MRKQQQSPAAEPEKLERWTAQRKVAIILEVLKGQISVPEASRNARLYVTDHDRKTLESMPQLRAQLEELTVTGGRYYRFRP